MKRLDDDRPVNGALQPIDRAFPYQEMPPMNTQPMTRIQQFRADHQPSYLPGSSFPVLNYNDRDFVMIPTDRFNALIENRRGWTILCIGGGLLAVSASVAIAAGALRPQAAPAAPVIVEKEVVVPTACLIFCGRN